VKEKNRRITRSELCNQLRGEVAHLSATYDLTTETTSAQLAGSTAARYVAFGGMQAKLAVIGAIGSGIEVDTQRIEIPDDAPEYVRSKVAAAYLGRAVGTLAQWSTRSNGPFAPYKQGRAVVWKVSEIRDYLTRTPKAKPRGAMPADLTDGERAALAHMVASDGGTLVRRGLAALVWVKGYAALAATPDGAALVDVINAESAG
jgi:hypothetical protein